MSCQHGYNIQIDFIGTMLALRVWAGFVFRDSLEYRKFVVKASM